MAAPFVSGALSVVIERFPGISNTRAVQILKETAEKLPGQGLGAGRIDLYAAMQPLDTSYHLVLREQVLSYDQIMSYGATEQGLFRKFGTRLEGLYRVGDGSSDLFRPFYSENCVFR